MEEHWLYLFNRETDKRCLSQALKANSNSDEPADDLKACVVGYVGRN